VALVFFIAMVFENGRLQAQSLLKQKNLELDVALKELREKNDQIMSSIHYAKRIQSAVLPADSYLRQANLDLFILFKPRDIVSGDFYWFHDKGDKIFLAVVDCTGHGVPGALMSMIGNSLLNKIVLEQGIEYPAEILERLQAEVRNVLMSEKTIHSSKEGMDVCLCIFSPKKSKVFFTGALRPLYKAARDKEKENWEIVEIKGERNFIGGRLKTNKRFKTHEIKMAPGNMLYLTTDGFADQFDDKNVRYGSGRLKTFLAEIAGLDTREQRQALIEELATHQGNGEQVDDITIIGIRAPLL
jgi:serine phosphatase RsbU (regulator of sigma subunit)